MALEICTSIASEIVKNLLNETIRQGHYSLQFKQHVEDLVKEKQNLLSQRKSIHDRVRKAKRDAQEIDILVMKWLDEANALIVEADLLEEKAQQTRCCLGHCPNLIGRCSLAKQIEQKNKEIVDQGNKCKFEQFARPATPPGIEYYSSEGFFLFDSTKLANDQLLEALKDDEISLVGLHGMGGCGKTTLAQQVGNTLKELFSRVVFVVVSSSVDIPWIQDSIASELGVKLEVQGDQGKAKNLWSKLNSAGNILIILDDVWEVLDFKAIGIPFGSNFKRCKVLLTARGQQVCTSMDCQRTIPLHLLNDEEAWRLFQYYACITSLTPDNMKALAKEIAHECKGLAIAIATVASTLKGKDLVEWEEALETLRDSEWMNIKEGLRDPYKCLMLSYDNLKDEDAKSVFLLCSVFPEDFEIHDEDLIRYGIGLGFFGRISSFRRARNKLSVAKNKLIDSCLLMKTNNGQCVKMHDLVRDVALWIAKKENREIASGKRSEEIMKACGSMEDNKIRYLWFDEANSSFSPQLHYSPNLIFLRVKLCVYYSLFTDDFFKALLELRVLVLEYWTTVWNRIPISFLHSLTNLHFLHLRGCELGDFSFMRSLKKLQSLTLRNCSFNNLPGEILQLESFKLLDVSGCGIRESPYKVMGRCSKLEELYFFENGQWVDEQEHACDIFCTGDFPKLQRYGVEIGRDFGLHDDFWTLVRSIAVEHFDVSTTNETVKNLVRRAESLCLKKIYGGCKNFIPEMIQKIGGIEELNKLVLHYSEDLEFFVDIANQGSAQFGNVLSKLIELQIKEMKSLKAFYRGTCPKAHHLLNMCNLKVFKLYNCPLLTHVFTFVMAENLAMLEVVEVQGCDELKHIVTDEMQSSQQRSNLVFQKLKRLSVSMCKQMEHLVTTLPNAFQSFEFASLNELCLSELPNLVSIFSENYYSRCSSLKDLTMVGCRRLNKKSVNDIVAGHTALQELGHIVTHSIEMSNEAALLQTLQSVESIDIRGSEHIEYVFRLTGVPLNVESTPLVSNLTFLTLIQLSELKYICEGPTQCISLQNLSQIEIVGCKELRIIFTVSIVRDLHQLCYLTIESCDKLEQIFEGEEFTGNLETTSNSSTPLNRSQNIGSFNLCSLKVIKVRDCPKLKGLLTLSTAKTLTSLRVLEIGRCGGLEYVIKDERVKANKSEGIVDDDGQDFLPNLKWLTVSECNEIRSLFNVSIVKSLPQLHGLTIKECDKLEQIMEGEESFDSIETTSKFSAPLHGSQNTGSFNFCSVESLEVTDCPMLKWLLTLSTAKTLTSLDEVTIERCGGLEYVIKDDRVDDVEQAIFPKLRKLHLRDLPNLIQVYSGLQFHSSLLYETENCPKLIPQLPVEGTKTASKDENEEVKKDSEEDKAVEEENILVPCDLNNAEENIVLESDNHLECNCLCCVRILAVLLLILILCTITR